MLGSIFESYFFYKRTNKCLGCFSCYCDKKKIPRQKQYKGENVYSDSQFEGKTHQIWEIEEAGAGGIWTNFIHSQEESNKCLCPSHFLLLYCPGSLPRNLCHLQWLGLPTSINLIKIISPTGGSRELPPSWLQISSSWKLILDITHSSIPRQPDTQTYRFRNPELHTSSFLWHKTPALCELQWWFSIVLSPVLCS